MAIVRPSYTLPRADSASTRSAPFSPTTMAAAFVLEDGIVGNTDASITRNRSMPCTRNDESTTEDPAAPIRQLPDGMPGGLPGLLDVVEQSIVGTDLGSGPTLRDDVIPPIRLIRDSPDQFQDPNGRVPIILSFQIIGVQSRIPVRIGGYDMHRAARGGMELEPADREARESIDAADLASGITVRATDLIETDHRIRF